MDPVEEFASIRAEIRRLEAREAELRQMFLRPAARLRSNRHEVVVRLQRRRLFRRERLPGVILSDPAYRDEVEAPVVTVRALAGAAPRRLPDEEPALFEPF